MAKVSPNKLFSPSQALRTSKRDIFTGRKRKFQDAFEGLAIDGSSLVIFGERGIGKTSFAWQIADILDNESHNESIDSLSLELIDELNHGKAIWYECKKDDRTIDHILLNLLDEDLRSGEHNGKNLFDQFPKVFQDKKIVAALEATFKLNIRVLSGEIKLRDIKKDSKITKEIEKLNEYRSIQQTIRRSFQLVIKSIKSKYPNKDLFIFLDEFDRVSDKSSIGTYIKSLDGARFCIVGVADTISEIVQDHESAERKLYKSKIELKGLTKAEINNFFNIIEKKTEN